MINIEKVEIYGWKEAVRGMRNSFNSWAKSDSYEENGAFVLGEADKRLMMTLTKGGASEGKFMRYITVMLDVTAPRYWWAEMDTYKVGTVRNSCSTMHKIHSKEFERADFSAEKLDEKSLKVLDSLIERLNEARKSYNESKDKNEWWQLIQLLPASYNQKATMLMNYQVLKNIYFTRRNHRLDEWHTFCDRILELPHADLITA